MMQRYPINEKVAKLGLANKSANLSKTKSR